MPHISGKKPEPVIVKQMSYILKAIIAGLKTENEAAVFLSSLLTKTEKIMLAKRLAMVVLITEGASETKIVETLKTTYATVEKMKLKLDKDLAGYQAGLKKLKQGENWQKLKKLLLGD